jgi:hypothetical protein
MPVSRTGKTANYSRSRKSDPRPSIPWRDYLLLSALTALIWGVNAVWLELDSRPPVWDMAMHQGYALNYLPGAMGASEGVPFWAFSGVYPPFVHVVIAFFYLLLHAGPHVATLANLPATALLFWSVYHLASDCAGPGGARWTCVLMALTPYLFWMSREAILDYWLSAWVAAGVLVLRRSDAFKHRNYSILFGCICALGLLTKWLFACFLFVPALYVLGQGRVWNERARLLNVVAAFVITSAFSSVWYLPNLSELARYFPVNAQTGALEGEPPVLSMQSFVYYVRLLEGYQFFAILFVLFLVSLLLTFKRKLILHGLFLSIAVAGAWLALTLIRTKDPRFSMPLLGLLLIVPGAWMHSWRRTWPLCASKILLISVLMLQAYAINFGISWLPQEVILAEGYQGSLRWDWNLYLQHYFHILGAPRQENWHQAEILRRVNKDATEHELRRTLALVPDLPRFNVLNFQLYARLLQIPCRVGRIVLRPDGIFPLDVVDYVLTTDGDQGMSWTTLTSRQLTNVVQNSSVFELVEQFPLPQGDVACLYRVKRSGPGY